MDPVLTCMHFIPDRFFNFFCVCVFCYGSACQSQSYQNCKTKHSVLILIGFLSDECRQIEFGHALSNSRLSTDRVHVIRVYHVQNEPSCRVKCFLEPDCVAYNYGKNTEGNLKCEICNKSHLQVPSNHVMVTSGFIFRPVAKVSCVFLFRNIYFRRKNLTALLMKCCVFKISKQH